MRLDLPNVVIFFWYFGTEMPPVCLSNLGHSVAEIIENDRDNVVILYTNKTHKMSALLESSCPAQFRYIKIKDVKELVDFHSQNWKTWHQSLEKRYKSPCYSKRPSKGSSPIELLIRNQISADWMNDLLPVFIRHESIGSVNIAYIVDVLRLIALIKHGGLYCDMDNIIINYGRPCSNSNGLILQVFHQKRGDRICRIANNNLIAATPSNIYIKIMLFDILIHFLWLSDFHSKKKCLKVLDAFLKQRICIIKNSSAGLRGMKFPKGLPDFPPSRLPAKYEMSNNDLRRNIGFLRWHITLWFGGPQVVNELNEDHDFEFDYFNETLLPVHPLLNAHILNLLKPEIRHLKMPTKDCISGFRLDNKDQHLEVVDTYMSSWKAVPGRNYEAPF